MRLPTSERAAIDRLKNHFLGKRIPGAGSWGEQDALRGWKDDFFGDVIHEQYTAVNGGGGAGAQLQPGLHGGWYNMWTAAAIGSWNNLWLGDAADGFATLDADLGWTIFLRGYVNSVAGIAATFGSTDVAHNNRCWAGVDTSVSANWILQTRTGGGPNNDVDSGIAADTSTHWFKLDAFPPSAGNRQVDFYLDGTLIASTTVSVPIAVLTPIVHVYAWAAANKSWLVDYWGVMPRNLA